MQVILWPRGADITSEAERGLDEHVDGNAYLILDRPGGFIGYRVYRVYRVYIGFCLDFRFRV